MKKVACFMLVFSLLGWGSVSAETTESSKENISETTSSSVDKQPVIKSQEENEPNKTVESGELSELKKEKELTVVDFGFAVITVKKNQQLKAQDFYQVVQNNEEVADFGIKEFKFADNQAPITDSMGKFPSSVKLTGVATDGTVKTFIMSYQVINDLATIKITDLKYDAEKKAITGKTIPKAVVACHGEVDTGYGQGHVFADENGYFEIADAYEVGTTWYIQAFDDQSAPENYSEVLEITIPDNKATTESSSADSKSNKLTNKTLLPQTGNRTNNILLIAGTIIFVVTSMLYCEKKFKVFQ